MNPWIFGAIEELKTTEPGDRHWTPSLFVRDEFHRHSVNISDLLPSSRANAQNHITDQLCAPVACRLEGLDIIFDRKFWTFSDWNVLVTKRDSKGGQGGWKLIGCPGRKWTQGSPRIILDHSHFFFIPRFRFSVSVVISRLKAIPDSGKPSSFFFSTLLDSSSYFNSSRSRVRAFNLISF